MRRAAWRYLVRRGADAAVLTRAFLDLGIMELSLRRHGFRRTLERIERSPARGPAEVNRSDFSGAERYARRINMAARFHPVNARCLHKSLVLHRWLRREGLPSHLRIGVLKEDGELKAHAWVELAGRAVNDRQEALVGFSRLTRELAERREQVHSRGD